MLTNIGFMVALGVTLVMPEVGHATESSVVPGNVTSPAPPPPTPLPPAQARLADSTQEVGRSFRQVGDSVERGAKAFGHAVEDGAKQIGRTFDEGWRSFKRGLNGD